MVGRIFILTVPAQGTAHKVRLRILDVRGSNLHVEIHCPKRKPLTVWIRESDLQFSIRCGMAKEVVP